MDTVTIEEFNTTAANIHDHNIGIGWWDDSEMHSAKPVASDTYLIPTKLCLAHSEISEAMEGHRKDLMDDHLPQYKMVIVEIADAIIRLLDVAEYICRRLNLPYRIGDVIAAKRAHNTQRADDKRENRSAPGGKAF